jgi:hypothetical protein
VETTTRLKAKKLDESGDDHPIAYREAINANADILEGVGSVRSIVAGEETRINAGYGLMPTPDQVELVLPQDHLIAIGYQALWGQTNLTGNLARAAIFVGANQLAINSGGAAAPLTQAAATVGSIAGLNFVPLFSSALGLLGASESAATGSGPDVTTGQILGGFNRPIGEEGLLPIELGGTLRQDIAPFGAGGPVYVFAAAGTYKISVQFKASAGGVTVKKRKLWAWVVA